MFITHDVASYNACAGEVNYARHKPWLNLRTFSGRVLKDAGRMEQMCSGCLILSSCVYVTDCDEDAFFC